VGITNLNPSKETSTTASIVPTVVILNTAVTVTKLIVLFVVTGYIRIGIKASQVPKTKIVNKINNVLFLG
jgi:hypothetical protein